MSKGSSYEVQQDSHRLVLVNQSRSFQLVFERLGESWHHVMGSLTSLSGYIRFHGDYARVLASVEADPSLMEYGNVPSPAYQDLRYEEGADGPRVLLLGKYGPHHYSSVFTLEEEQEAVVLQVDLADRCREAFQSLNCTYYVKNIVEVETPTERLVRAGCVLTKRRFFQVEAEPPAFLKARSLDHGATMLSVVMAPLAEERTQRCRYRLRWSALS